jgi:hypothetical protein
LKDVVFELGEVEKDSGIKAVASTLIAMATFADVREGKYKAGTPPTATIPLSTSILLLTIDQILQSLVRPSRKT